MKILRRGEKTTNSDVMVEIFCRKQGLSLFTNRGGEEVLCKANRRIGCCPPSWHSLKLKDLDLKAEKNTEFMYIQKLSLDFVHRARIPYETLI